MKARILSSIADIDATQWNALLGCDYPFLQHDFLLALEQHDCLTPWGWQPVYFMLQDEHGLAGACATYIKTNSYGEFVFDWAWADAYARNGIDYYPKLVSAIPFTPAKGARLLSRDDNSEIKQQLIELILAFCDKQKLSSAHFLFCESDDMQALQQKQLLRRFDYQYHWHNRDYQNFDDFLQALNAKRRKNIKRERRQVRDAGIRVVMLRGDDLNEQQWQQLHDFYAITFMRKSGTATFTLEFFRAMAHRLRAIFAYDGDRAVAGAVCYEGGGTLYGRHWGCYDHYDNLHFEVCYYQGIEHCIANNLQRFEPGAQGEHKIWRGFLPVKTESAHWIADPRFRQAIADFLQNEHRAMQQYGESLMASSPYRLET